MSTSVTYVGNAYSIPAYNDTGYAQGSGNISSYLIALATGSLTLSGGTFTLTADANFGGSFGLIALYYDSVSANISTSGVLRLSNTDALGWRNFLGNGNLLLSVNTSNQLLFNSIPVAVTNTDITLTTAGTGLVVKTPDGTKTFRIYVDNNGELSVLELT